MRVRSVSTANLASSASDEQLRKHIVLRSSSLYERLESLGSSKLRCSADESALHRLDAWRGRLSIEGRDLLARRLSFDQIGLGRVLEALCEEPVVVGDCEWYWKFQSAIDGLATGLQCPVNEAASALPFFEILQGLAANAVRELSADSNWSRLCDTAQRDAVCLLLQRISVILQWCLYADFDQMRRDTADNSNVYARFVDAARGRKWINSFFTRYAGVARPLAIRLAQWQCYIRELLSRFDDDKEALALFRNSEKNHTIYGLEAFPSDPHNHGRFVAIIQLGNGQRLVYKPAEAQLSELWRKALEIVGFKDSPSPKALNRTDYSWHEFVGADESNADPTDDYFQHLGRLIGLATAIGSSDLHYGGCSIRQC